MQVGFAGELSGRESDLGIGSRNGVLLAAEQINAAGGIDGHPIEIIVKDDAGKPDVARQVDQELVDVAWWQLLDIALRLRRSPGLK